MRIFIEIDGILMIEMEYADGGNLAEFLVKQTVRIEEKDILGTSMYYYTACNCTIHFYLMCTLFFKTKIFFT